MAAWPSLHMEERNLLRQREWERRNQEAQQQQEQYQDNAPLFGEPYKTNKGDELSSRIQRMLGNYEDMKDLHKNFGCVPKDLSASIALSRPTRPTHSDTYKPPFQHPPLPHPGNQVTSSSLSASQPTSKKPLAPDRTSLSSTYSHPSTVDNESGSPESGKGDLWPDMRDCASLPPVLSALSPPSGPLSPLHSSDPSDPSDSEQPDTDGKDSPGPRQQPSLSQTTAPSRPLNTDEAPPQLEAAQMEGTSEAIPLASQTFPLPLSSKPSMVMPQKPTAYVRPLDGQDQVTSDSPELKPSPDFDRQPYEGLGDLKCSSKSGLAQLKIPPSSLEALSSDAQCVEEILREMTHTWPPLLTAIHTPSTADLPKFSFPSKESQHGHTGYPHQKHEPWRGPSPPPPTLPRQEEPPVALARSSEGETASSSESESSSGSESDSESSESGGEELEEALPHLANSPPQAKADGPAVNEWQLGRWLKEPQPSLGAETQGETLHSSPSSPACSPKVREVTASPRHYNSHNSPARPEPASPAQLHCSYNAHSSPLQPETTTPAHYNYNAHSSPVRTEPCTPSHFNYNSQNSPVVGPDTSSPVHYSSSSHTSPVRSESKRAGSKQSFPKQHRSQSPPPPLKDGDKVSRKTKGKKKPSSKLIQHEDGAGHGMGKAVATHQRDPSLAESQVKPKVKTKAESATKVQTKGSSKANKKTAKHLSSKTMSMKEKGPAVTVKLAMLKESDPRANPPPIAQDPLSAPHSSASVKPSSNGKRKKWTDDLQPKSKKNMKSNQHHQEIKKSLMQGTSVQSETFAKGTPKPPRELMVKIQLSLLSRVPAMPKTTRVPVLDTTAGPNQKRPGKGEGAPTKGSRKRAIGKEDTSQPKKKVKLDTKSERSSSLNSSSSFSSSTASSCPGSSKAEAPKPNVGVAAVPSTSDDKGRKKKKKAPGSSTQAPAIAQEPRKGVGHKRPRAPHTQEPKASGPADTPTIKHKKSSSKRSEHTKTGKKSPNSSFAIPEPTQPKAATAPSRALLKVDDRQYSLEHHMKEAKKLKHKADAMSDKVGKSLFYLDAALSFVESGIAMELDPQTPKSAYTMFSETVDLIKFILKLKSFLDPASPTSEKDFAILCMRFQSLLQMAMFRYKREAALKYSRTLTDHFKSCKMSPSPRVSRNTNTPSQMSPMASPASSTSSGPVSSHSSMSAGVPAGANMVALPQGIQQMASTYVTITALFLSAHTTWEQADELSSKGSGLLLDLDAALGPLTLLSCMSTVVRYIRQGLHWLKQDSQHSQ